tara:strand:- start:1328 stop:2182 length:855 start_codon:yes stop_codon:yes gene_type:complete
MVLLQIIVFSAFIKISFGISLRNMSKSKQVVCIHANYKHLRTEIINETNNVNGSDANVFDNGRNLIAKVEIENEQLSVKSFKIPNRFNGIVYKFFRKSKAKRSYEYANRLLKAEILTPFPIAYIEEFNALGLKRSYYISKHVDYDFDFRELIHNPKFQDRENILKQFTEFTFKLHENNINFLDHSPGNTLITKVADGDYNFYLIDLNRMQFETMNFEKRMHNFRRLWLSKTMIKIMAVRYAELYGKTLEETRALMLKNSRAFQKRIDAKKLRKAGRRLKFKSTD